MKKLFALIALLAIVSVPVLAGDLNAPPAPQDPPPASAVTNAVLTVILTLLPH